MMKTSPYCFPFSICVSRYILVGVQALPGRERQVFRPLLQLLFYHYCGIHKLECHGDWCFPAGIFAASDGSKAMGDVVDEGVEGKNPGQSCFWASLDSEYEDVNSEKSGQRSQAWENRDRVLGNEKGVALKGFRATQHQGVRGNDRLA